MAKSNKLEQQSNIEPVKKIETIDKEIDTSEKVTPLHIREGGYVEFENRLFNTNALKELRPDLFSARADVGYQSQSNFGTQFPRMASKGDMFVRVDVLPNRVFKFDGNKWLEQNKDLTQSYLEKDYLDFLVNKLDKGEYDLEHLTDNEKSELETYLKGNQNS